MSVPSAPSRTLWPGTCHGSALPGNLAPTAETLGELQRRHLDAVPYENLAIMLGQPDSTDSGQTLERIAAGGNAGTARTTPRLNHLALLVTLAAVTGGQISA
jgi:hypothetical protein